MRILISHHNYPAQFRRLAPALVEAGHEVVFLAQALEWHAPESHKIRLLGYHPHRGGGGESLHPYLRRMDSAVLAGQAAYRACSKLKAEGWEPDCVINHVGFGNGLYISDVFPLARRICLFEWYYNAVGSDVDFLRRGAVEPDRAMRLRTWNAQTLLELAHCDAGVVPTDWQLSQFPQHLRSRLQVIHEGIDVDTLGALREKTFEPFSCLPQSKNIEVLTYVSRGFEEYRGFPQAMEAIALLQKKRPSLHVLVAGADIVAYGANRSDGRTWGEWAKTEIGLDPVRTHWLGMLQDVDYWRLLAISDVHFYLTVPFVLSWSLLEAMAAGCSIVASATPPVQEVLRNGENALLVDFFEPNAQAEAIGSLLDDSELRQRFGAAAKLAAFAYSSDRGLAAWNILLEGFQATS